ncbi:MAG TPA: RidA family protein [Gaiellaceae bacterium]|nr:RidA family protein [Gaiellaceae bacterium]
MVGREGSRLARPVIVNPPELPEPVGFAHAVAAGGAVYLGGQTGEGASLVEQFDAAAGRLVTALRAAGGEPDQLVSLVVYTTDIEDYRASTRELGEVWRRHFGRRYPAMALLGVSALFDPKARVELMGVAVLDG